MATEQEKDILRNNLRVVLNTIQLLLNEGTFLGKHGLLVHEAATFMQGLADQLQTKVKESSLLLPDKNLTVVPAGSVPTESGK